MQTCYLAVDIGASSGRHIIGTVEHGVMALHEVYRFENRLIEKNGHLCWDMECLVQNVIEGLKAAHDAGYTPTTVGIDTWAVDFLLLDADGTPIGDPVAYRDGRTAAMREELEPILPFTKLYARTGIQYQSFNTVYQLCALKKEHPEQLAAAEHFLMVPDYLNYRLTGVMANEYTNASTTALVARAMEYDPSITNGKLLFARIEEKEIQLIVDQWIQEIVYGLVSIIHLLNPSCIILGGGIMEQPYIPAQIEKQLMPAIMPSFRGLTIKKAELGNQAGMLGASILGDED